MFEICVVSHEGVATIPQKVACSTYRGGWSKFCCSLLGTKTLYHPLSILVQTIGDSTNATPRAISYLAMGGLDYGEYGIKHRCIHL